MRRLSALGVAVLALSISIAISLPPASAPAKRGQHARHHYPWHARIASARKFARQRIGSASFSIVGEHGKRRGLRAQRQFHSASVVKAMLLVSYLRRSAVRHRRLDAAEKAVLEPMIQRSDNGAANSIYARVGNDGLNRLAQAAGMRRFEPDAIWGASEITAADQAPFFFRLRRYIPKRHRRFAFHLLSHVVSEQRWGVPRARPRGWRVYFKGGWTPSSGGWRTNQVALLRRGHHKLALAILTEGNPSLEYGAKTIQGVTARLLRRYNRITAPGVK